MSTKADNLIKLKKAGFKVPDFLIFAPNTEKTKILKEITKNFPKTLFFAVRSSASIEDSEEKSFAGHFYSAIAVKKEDVYEEFLNVIDSYKESSGLVIIQEFIPSDVSGVLFTQTEKNKLIINSNIGLCTSVVNGEKSDEYILDKNGKLIEKNIPINKKVIIFKDFLKQDENTQKESLDPKKIQKLTKIAKKIQNLFGKPQDVEWCFYKEKLYILQSRPITKNINIKTKEYFDNANIAESYSGIVLPLTSSFAKTIYSKVYEDLFRMSGVSKNKINSYKEIFENLIETFYGRMYYNMNNWYKLAQMVPGYQVNKKNFEIMITSNIKEEIPKEIRPSLFLKIFYPALLILKILFFKLFILYFKNKTNRYLKKANKIEYKNLNYEETIYLYEEINKNLLNDWYIAVENDFMVMSYLGILQKILKKGDVKDYLKFKSKGTEQIVNLINLSKTLEKNKKIWSSVLKKDTLNFKKEIELDTDSFRIYRKYLEDFGGRFANELKLETQSIEEDMDNFFNLLQIYNKQKNPEKIIKYKKIELPFFKKVLFIFFLNKFKKHASKREEFRLIRSNAFLLVRNIFNHLGDELYKNKIIKEKKDIFYFEIKELFNIKKIFSKSEEIGKIINERKKQYEEYAKVNPPTHFYTFDRKPPEINSKNIKNNNLTGRGASSGKIKGIVKVFKNFEIIEKIDFDIMVTKHTDPGWTSLIAMSKGLIIEHGGLLSHASIVARELGIPAIIGVENATSIFKDGDLVEINGETGEIIYG